MLLDAKTASSLTNSQNGTNVAQLQKIDALIREAIIQGFYFVRVFLPLSGLVQGLLETKGYVLTPVADMGQVMAHIEVSWPKHNPATGQDEPGSEKVPELKD